MAEAKLAPKLPQWMSRSREPLHLSGGSEGHIYTVTPPGYSELHVPSLLLTTAGRKSGEKYVFPLFYGDEGDSYIIVASKGGAPDHPVGIKPPRQSRGRGPGRDEKSQGKGQDRNAAERERLWEKAVKFWPPYADYAKKTERQIPWCDCCPVGSVTLAALAGTARRGRLSLGDMCPS